MAVKTVDVRARVQGYLEKVLFKEGMEVKEGEPLFIIDPRIYKAEYDRALANLAQAKAHLTRTDGRLERAKELLPEQAIAQSDYDLAKGDRDEAVGLVEVAEAALHTTKLNLDWTVVTAPISGRISNQRVDPGNLVLADNTLLTTIVSLDPVYVYFDVDERTSLGIRRQISAGKVKSARESEGKVSLALADEGPNFIHAGTIDFIDNAVDPMTGTLRLRGVFPNPQRIILPGNYAKVRTQVGDPHEAIMVAEKALGSDQGERFLYVVKEEERQGESRIPRRIPARGNRGAARRLAGDFPGPQGRRTRGRQRPAKDQTRRHGDAERGENAGLGPNPGSGGSGADQPGRQAAGKRKPEGTTKTHRHQ